MDYDVFNKLYSRKQDRAKYGGSPYKTERESYIAQIMSEGFKTHTVKTHAFYQLMIIQYIPSHVWSNRKCSEQDIVKARDAWSDEYHKPELQEITKRTQRSLFIYVAKKWFSMLGIYKDTHDNYYCKDIMLQYLEWLHSTIGTPQSTLIAKKYVLKGLFSYLENAQIRIQDVMPANIDDYLIFKSSQGLQRNSISSVVYVLRSFFSYLEDKGISTHKVAYSIHGPRVYKNEQLPSYIPWENVQHIISNYPHETAIQKRNFAMLLLFAIYGLRCSEVINLKLNDIDWRNETIYLFRAKDSRPQMMPLVDIVGNAIIDYICNGRPNNYSSQEIFLRSRSPFQKMTTGGAYRVAGDAISGENIKTKHHGPHVFRHSVATHLVNNGHSMKEVADMLGHQNLDTTRIYAKVDFNNLSKVADMDWSYFV